MNHSSVSAKNRSGAVKRGNRFTLSVLEVGQVESQALLMKSLHAEPHNRTLERVRKSRSSLETDTQTAVRGEEMLD